MSIFSSLFSDPIPAGEPAPDFTALDQDGGTVSLSAFRGVANVVLVFYPADETPGCRKQLCEFRDQWTLAQTRNVLVFGVNPQSASSHQVFRANRNFPFPLLVDERKQIASLYRAGGLIIRRTVYLIGKSGIIRFSRRGAPSPEEVFVTAE